MEGPRDWANLRQGCRSARVGGASVLPSFANWVEGRPTQPCLSLPYLTLEGSSFQSRRGPEGVGGRNRWAVPSSRSSQSGKNGSSRGASCSLSKILNQSVYQNRIHSFHHQDPLTETLESLLRPSQTALAPLLCCNHGAYSWYSYGWWAVKERETRGWIAIKDDSIVLLGASPFHPLREIQKEVSRRGKEVSRGSCSQTDSALAK